MKTISDETAKVCEAALLQMLKYAVQHAKTAQGMGALTSALWNNQVERIKAAAAELATG